MGRLIGKKKKSSAARFFALLLAAVLFVGTGVTASAARVNPVNDEDPNFIIVQKNFIGISKDQIPEDFTVTVKGESTYVLTKGGTGFSASEDGLKWTWKIMNADVGEYSVTESNHTIDGYDNKSTGLGVITVSNATLVMGNPEVYTTCNHNNWPVEGGTFFAAALTSNTGCVVITEKPLSASQRKTVAKKVVSIGGNWKEPVYFYSIEEQIKTGDAFSVNGKTVTYDSEKGEIVLGNTSDWSHVATMTYKIDSAQSPEIAITNTYTPKTTDVTISKSVKGNMGDVNKEFNFEMTVTNTPEGFSPVSGEEYEYTVENNVYKFSLSNGETITIPDLPLGATIQINETNADGYEKTAIVKTGLEAEGGQSVDMDSIKVESDLANKVITIVNTKDVNIDTGISLTSLPYILVLITAAAGMLAIVLRRRHSN
ncbi:MAG: DUF5979 domain-containing protein [Firmicutes bacterium]|nr:DUF5979 domain-containing protein [Bacillota bacterium]